MKMLRNPILWGAGGLAILTVAAMVAGLLYINPPGKKIVTFYTTDAAAIHSGDQVRIAGIPVGKIESLAIEPHQVRVQAQVDDYAFIGDNSQVQVRMLTVVGGYYVDLISLGDTPLGAAPIPVERVTMPYSLIQTLADTTTITDNLHPTPIKQSLDEAQRGLAGTNLESISAIIDAGNSLVSTLDKQRGQLSEILNMSDEYIRALNKFGDEFKEMIRNLAILEQTLVIYGKRSTAAFVGIGDIFQVVKSMSEFYMNHRDRFLEEIRDWQQKARFWDDRAGSIVRTLRLVRNKLERVVDAQNAPPELLATDVCVPVPGSPC